MKLGFRTGNEKLYIIKDLEDFVRDTTTKGFDLMNSKLDFETLYKGIYFDKLVEK